MALVDLDGDRDGPPTEICGSIMFYMKPPRHHLYFYYYFRKTNVSLLKQFLIIYLLLPPTSSDFNSYCINFVFIGPRETTFLKT